MLDLNDNAIRTIDSLGTLSQLEVLRIAENSITELDALLALPALRIVEVWESTFSCGSPAYRDAARTRRRGSSTQEERSELWLFQRIQKALADVFQDFVVFYLCSL